ncbi:MAG: hypothetical protein JO092_05120 [Candidatus Eremiobacteraeota bacterium]|nr:hypothetical protein [Candidatus Eremiobacteraeota bacterium]MBV8375263.1 hypothetical protein [Candidatus Eremiobacteraeota bacterium]
MLQDPAEIWIRLRSGRSICERYNQLEMAEFMKGAMVERLRRGEPLICFDGEPEQIPADQVERIDLLLAHESPVRRGTKTPTA